MDFGGQARSAPGRRVRISAAKREARPADEYGFRRPSAKRARPTNTGFRRPSAKRARPTNKGSCLRTNSGSVPRRGTPHVGCDRSNGNLTAPYGRVAQRPMLPAEARDRPGRNQDPRSVDVRGRAGFPADHRPASARGPSPLPSCRFPFPVRLQGVPTDACRRVSEPASASSPSLRVRRARRGAGPPGVRGPRERGSADLTWPCLPRTRSFEVPSSGVPATVDSRYTPPRHERVRDDEQCAFGPWLPGHSIPFRPRGFSPPRRFSPHRGVRACCVPVPDMGFAAFLDHQATETEVSRRVAGRLRSRRRGSRPGSSQRRPFEGLILAGSRAASLRSLPPRRLVRPSATPADGGRRTPPRTAEQSGRRRFRRAPGGRGLAAVPSECGVLASGVCRAPPHLSSPSTLARSPREHTRGRRQPAGRAGTVCRHTGRAGRPRGFAPPTSP
jgi:hypothetical protein